MHYSALRLLLYKTIQDRDAQSLSTGMAPQAAEVASVRFLAASRQVAERHDREERR
ncbi:MAG: hypothetical protein K0Q46_1421 [Rhodococcus erythropolis]|jgi:hypothetical protein|nr:hypothetical protein [Rhodococcus erythropolis]MCW2428450.1 hypothetical protein [Rhodococcus erythropolis]MDF2894635.1 hypothetical protein [Rhodococcus erythropolis]GCB54339.1 hypothetical protein rerp_07470 [Rhodococcus erythropolis]